MSSVKSCQAGIRINDKMSVWPGRFLTDFARINLRNGEQAEVGGSIKIHGPELDFAKGAGNTFIGQRHIQDGDVGQWGMREDFGTDVTAGKSSFSGYGNHISTCGDIRRRSATNPMGNRRRKRFARK